MISIRSGRGLGDSLYLQSVVRHLTQRNRETYAVMTNYPDVFLPLRDRIEIRPFTRTGVKVIAHYVSRKSLEGTTQFEDCCISAGIRSPVEMKIDWRKPLDGPAATLQAFGQPVVLVQMPRAPMDRKDGFGREILPDCRVIQRVIDGLKGRALIVQIGAGRSLYKFEGIDVDLANRTSIAELMDIASIASGFLGYCSFMIPLAETFHRRALFVWSRKGLRSGNPFLQTLTPEKVLHCKDTSDAIIDDCEQDEIDAAIERLTRV